MSARRPCPWLIVGAGIHGVHLTYALIEQAHISASDIALIDPAPQPLHLWRQRTARCGMRHLRSPAAHNLAGSAHALLRFADAPAADDFSGPYRRPSLSLFHQHIEQTVLPALADCHYHTGRVCRLQLDGDLYSVDVCLAARREVRQFSAERVILALGAGRPYYPPGLEQQPQLQHLFDENYRAPTADTLPGTVLVGTGLSGVQAALSLSAVRAPLKLVGPPPRVAAFDSDPCFLGPRCLRGFDRLRSPVKRRRAIQRARRPGSIPEQTEAALALAIKAGLIEHINDRATAFDGHILRLANQGKMTAHHIVLATGFEKSPPGGQWLQDYASAQALPVDERGYPLPDSDLQWGPGLFVSGRLAELKIGPVAPNIAGARLAARRIVRQALAKG